MKSSFIIIIFLFFISTFVLAYLCSTTVLNKSEGEKLSKKERLHLSIPFTLIISTIIYIGTISLFLSFLTLFIFLSVFSVSLFTISKWLRDIFTTTILSAFSIIFLLIWILSPIKDSEPQRISEDVIKLEKCTDFSENNVVIELTKDDKKLHSIMKYDNKIELPFIIYDDDLTVYEISNKKDEKIVITKFKIKHYTILAYLGFTKPTVTYYNGYSLYLNEDSIKYD